MTEEEIRWILEDVSRSEELSHAEEAALEQDTNAMLGRAGLKSGEGLLPELREKKEREFGSPVTRVKELVAGAFGAEQAEAPVEECLAYIDKRSALVQKKRREQETQRRDWVNQGKREQQSLQHEKRAGAAQKKVVGPPGTETAQRKLQEEELKRGSKESSAKKS